MNHHHRIGHYDDGREFDTYTALCARNLLLILIIHSVSSISKIVVDRAAGFLPNRTSTSCSSGDGGRNTAVRRRLCRSLDIGKWLRTAFHLRRSALADGVSQHPFVPTTSGGQQAARRPWGSAGDWHARRDNWCVFERPMLFRPCRRVRDHPWPSNRFHHPPDAGYEPSSRGMWASSPGNNHLLGQSYRYVGKRGSFASLGETAEILHTEQTSPRKKAGTRSSSLAVRAPRPSVWSSGSGSGLATGILYPLVSIRSWVRLSEL